MRVPSLTVVLKRQITLVSVTRAMLNVTASELK
jgi:hypothetical protein